MCQRLPIAGYKTLSLVDYPNRYAFTVWTQGCNLSCDYCFNKELIPTKDGVHSWDEVFELIKHSPKIQAVVFTGGEPTLHSGLRNAISDVKSLGLLAGLHSNGSGEYFTSVLAGVDYLLLSHQNAAKLDICSKHDNLKVDLVAVH